MIPSTMECTSFDALVSSSRLASFRIPSFPKNSFVKIIFSRASSHVTVHRNSLDSIVGA